MIGDYYMKTVLITGANSGIGREFAKIYAQNNYNLVIISRRYERMNELKEYILKNINSKLIVRDNLYGFICRRSF